VISPPYTSLTTLEDRITILNPEFNEDQKIPQFPSCHLEEHYKLAIPDRAWPPVLPAHFYVPSATSLPLFCAIKNK